MQLIIQNKWISMGGSSTVKDTYGNDVFKVDGRFFSATRKKYLTDLEGNVKFIIRNKFFSLFGRRAYVLDDKENIIAEVNGKILSIHDSFNIISSLGNLKIEGNILHFNYRITINGQEIGHISRGISVRDSFVLTIEDDFDAATFVALVIAIDNITDRNQNKSN